ncbi:recombination-associated protein RdgC [Thiococcus pfennigii]|uniref:recombination-associated protein RdgC n=1 Tax=Thiococcus pfennigii TaxID=1057 RepID=UPI001904A919|nr:recombination-associated protein RdgC [Thiococcus pfennigii]MBK1699777.1 hypothetical protein [Thiococcus pfennigii]
MFRNARLFALPNDFRIDTKSLGEAISSRPSRPCGPLDMETLGWTAPLGTDAAPLLHTVNGCFLACARLEQRVLPAGAIRDALNGRIAAIEQEEARTVWRAERRRLRERLIDEMLPKAFTQSRRVLLSIDSATGWLVVDAASATLAEDVVSLLRDSLESLPVSPPRPSNHSELVLTSWITDRPPSDITLLDSCELRDSEGEGEVVRIAGMDLLCEEVIELIRAGKHVTQLAVDWDGRLRFALSEDLWLKRLRLVDELPDELGEDAPEDPAARLDAEFALFSGQMRRLIDRMSGWFGLGAEERTQ